MNAERGMRNAEFHGRGRVPSSAVACIRVLSFALLGGSAFASPLDDQMAAFKKADKQTEAAVAAILKTGLQEKRAAEAVAVAKPWLDSNPSASLAADVYAGLAMQYAGEWPAAVTFYRKILKNPALDPKLGGDVVPMAYRLLLNSMQEPESAYVLMREDGDRLRAFGNAKQFDAWFIDEAKRRNDVPAVCGRVAAIFSAAPPNVVPDTADLEWVCAKFESFTVTDETWMQAALKLVALPQVPEKYRARVNWVKEIGPYTKEATALFRANKPISDALADKPLKAAEALLAVLPYEGSILVARGWMNFREGHTPNLWKYTSPRRDAKTAPLIKALASLTPQQAQAVLSARGCPQGRPVIQLFYAENGAATAEMKILVKSLPDVFNSLAAPDTSLFSGTLTVDEAKALAPSLARNPSGHAALVRAYAVAGTNTLGAMVPVIMKSEIWRFNAVKSAVDLVWGSGAKQDAAAHAELCKQYATLGARYDQVKKQVTKEASAQDRTAAFNTLLNDLMAAGPTIPDALSSWNELFRNAPAAEAVAMLKTLLANLEGDREFLFRQAAASVPQVGGHAIYTGPEWDGFMHSGIQNANYKVGVTPLVPDLQRILSAQIPTGRISEYWFAIWLHAARPQDESARALMKTLADSPAYARLDPAYPRVAADSMHFGGSAMTPAMLAKDPGYLCRELLALPADAAPAAVEAALKTAVERVAQAPAPVPVIGLRQVAALPEIGGELRTSLLSLFDSLAPTGDFPGGQGYEQLGVRLVQDLQKEKQWALIVPYAAGLWRSAGTPDDDRFFRTCDALTVFAEEALKDGALSPALSVARMGLKIRVAGMDPGNTQNGGQQRVGRLRQLVGKASVTLGIAEIPVDETHPAYPIYKSSAEFMQGNLESAWGLYKANQDALTARPGEQGQALLRKLPTAYCFWLLNRTIEEKLSGPAEGLVKELTIWSREAEGVFSAEQEAELKIAFADLAFQKGALPTARAWYRKVADAREYRSTSLHLRAALGSVKVDRVTKNFGPALEELDKLLQIPDRVSRSKVHYARAEVLMDQENYKDAFDEIGAVLRGDPDNSDALILKGKIQIQMRKLVEASEIEVGITKANKVLVPGETLKISLIDPTLDVSGVGADIEIEVWAKSGDRERVLLYPLGDSRDKFRAEVPTALAPPVAGDKTLQVLGADEIGYGYSARFRAKMKDLPPDPKVTIGVASDAQLALSAGAFPPRAGERGLDLAELGLSTAQRTLGLRTVRPGNPIYIRVIDPDESKTAGVDTLAVTVQSSSGDEIRRLLLKETGPYTGEFEGIVPTAGAQAMAFASESAPGRDPNMAISPAPYPGWLGKVGDVENARTFGVDLNDNVALGAMTIRFDGGDSALTRFVLQTSMNGREWVTRARHPLDEAPWDGHPHVSSFPTYRGGLSVISPKGRELPSDWPEKMELTSARASCSYLAATVSNLAAGVVRMVETGHPQYPGLMRYRALFYQPAAAIRTFRLTGQPEASTVFLLDGQPAGKESQDPLSIERKLEPGLHEIQVWLHGSRDKITGSKPVLTCDVPGKAELTPCPDRMFDPAAFPEGVRMQVPRPASITNTTDGAGVAVAFGNPTQARLVRLVILGYKGVAPAIKSVTLTDRQGVARLPVKEDFLTLRQNQQLEVLPGDQIIARYDDEVTATPNRNKHEQRLQVAFNTAAISASFLNYETTVEGRRLKLEPIRRFPYGAAVAIVIDDADMDSSPAPDVIEFKAVASSGTAVTLKAVETAEHSGRFLGRVFPVEGKPARESEIQVPPGGTLTATYRDQENLNPGIPADRSVTLEHALYAAPGLSVYTTSSEPLTAPPRTPPLPSSGGKPGSGPEVVTPRRALTYAHVADVASSGTGLKGVIGASLRFDVVAPHLALAESSEIVAYVQTRAPVRDGEKGAAKAEGGMPFDVTLPGTLKLTARPAGASVSVPAGYVLGQAPVPPTSRPPLDEGRFAFSVPLVLGERPARSYATKDAESLPASSIPSGLAVRSGDVVDIGFAYKDGSDRVQWKTASVTAGSHAFLDVMNESYNEPLGSAFVGEKVFVRVLAPGLDQGTERDRASVTLKAAVSGASGTFSLRETEPHSGVFKGVFTLGYADATLPPQLPPVELNGFPVRYGDEVTIGYAASDGDPAQSATVRVNKGADGSIEPFSKRFDGDEMAVKTSFTLAECFFELAKKHRQMEQESLARREMGHAQKLLSEAIATHHDDELRAHAEYLLGNLAQEFADLAKNDETKLPMYQDALARFSKIPVDYPDTEFAPKAQFKTALVYEKMKEAEIAVEEYVKLAYKYPKCEFIPEAMSRLGGYFQSKGQALKEKADPLREKTDVKSKAEVMRLDEQSYPEFLRAALIFAKLQERFPDHDLAGLSGLRSAQNYMRVHQYEKAIEGFKKVIDNETYDAREIRSQALYWTGLSYERWAGTDRDRQGNAIGKAYQSYRRVTYDFPDSKWAKQARGRLADPVFAKIMEAEELARQRMLDGLKTEAKRRR